MVNNTDSGQQQTRHNPYVGAQTFKREHSRYFFGRNAEAQDLLFLLMARRLVLLYAESGAGKSSLINAKLRLDLEKEGFEVLPSTRVVSGEADPSLQPDNVFITNVMLNLDESDERPERFSHLRLADYLLDLVKVDGKYYYLTADEIGGVLESKAAQLAAGSAPSPPADAEGELLHDVLDASGASKERELSTAKEDLFLEEKQERIPPRALIIDQFEELFSTHPGASKARKDFFEQIKEAMEADPFLHVLLSIRQDYLAALTKYAHLLPGELRTRYQMERLSGKAALKAIRLPAKQVKLCFVEAEDPSQDVARVLVSNLQRPRTGRDAQDVMDTDLDDDFVEPVQLQVVCHELWPRLTRRPDEESESDGLRSVTGAKQIGWDDLLAICGDQDPDAFLSGFVTDALGDFYKKTIRLVRDNPKVQELGKDDRAQAVSERKVREWFEQELITEAQTRGQVFRGDSFTGREPHALPNVVVELLEDSHVIRSEARDSGTWYELVHDRFIQPIRDSNQEYRLWHAQHKPWVNAAYEYKAAPDPSLLYADSQLRDALDNASEQDRQDSIVEAFLQTSLTKQRQRNPWTTSAYGWHEADRDPNLLYTGSQLEGALKKVSEQDRRDPIVDVFLRESAAAQQRRDLAAKQRDLAAAARRVRGQRSLIILLASLFLFAAVAAWLGITSRNIAREDKKRAEDAQGTAEYVQGIAEDAQATAEASEKQTILARQQTVSSRVAAAASFYVSSEFEPALLLSLEALEWHDSFETRQLLFKWLLRGDDRSTSERGLGQPLSRVAFGPDGKIIAAASIDGSIALWDIEDNELGCQRSFMDTRYPVYGLAFSPDGQALTLASAIGAESSPDSENHSITLWDITSKEPAGQVLTDQIPSVGRIAFSPDGQTLAAGNISGTVTLWKGLSASDPTSVTLPGGHSDWVWAVEFNPEWPDVKMLASASKDSTIILWELEGGDWVSKTLKDHREWVNDVAFSPDGQTLASASADDTLILWNLADNPPTGHPLIGHYSDVSSVAFSPDGKMLASGSWDQSIKLWNVETGLQIGSALTKHTGGVRDVAFGPVGQTLASVGEDGNIILWDIDEILDQPLILYASRAPDATALSLDANKLAMVSDDDTIALWDLATGGPMRLLSNKDRVTGMTFSSDGKTLAVMGNDDDVQNVTLWSVKSGPITVTHQFLLEHTIWVSNSLALNPEGDKLAIASAKDTDIILWDLKASDPVYEFLSEHIGPVNDVAFSPDGKTLASASDDHTIILWNIATGRLVTEPLSSPTGEVWSVAFSPDGQMLASASSDGMVLLWDITTGKAVGLLPGHSERISSMAFSEDGQTLFLAGPSTVITRAISLEGWSKLACEIAGRNLTQTEWENAYGPDEHYDQTCLNFPIHPTVIEAETDKGKRFARRLEIENARVAFEQANVLIEEYNEYVGERDEISRLDPDQEIINVLIERARELAGQDKRSVAQEYLLQAVSQGQTFGWDLDKILDAGQLIGQGRQQILDREYDKALLSLNKAVELDPQFELEQGADLANLYNDLCMALWGFDPARALSACERAAELASATNDAMLNRSVCQNGSKKELASIVAPSCEKFGHLTNNILFGKTAQGELESGHSDTWVFEGRAEQRVSIQMNQDCSELDPRLILQGPDWRPLNTNYDGGDGLNAEIESFVLPQDGFYFINAGGSKSGAYTLSLAKVTVEEIDFGDTVAGDVKDDAVWTFEGQAGDTVSIAMDEDGSGLDAWLSLRGPDGTTLSTGDNSGDNAHSLIHNFSLPKHGSYTILPQGYGHSGAYTLSLTKVTPETINFGELVSGTVEAGVTWAFEGQTGQIVSIAMDEDGSGLDAFLTLKGPDGTILTTDYDSGDNFNSLIRDFVLPEHGSYTILPDGWYGGRSGAYTLLLTKATSETIDFGESVLGDFEDDVVWAFGGQAGDTVSIAMDEGGSGLPTLLSLVGPDGTTLGTGDDNYDNGDSLIRNFVLPEHGPYTILPDGLGRSGAYTLSLTTATVETISDESVSGDTEDGVLWAFEGQVGDIVSIAMNKKDGDGLDPFLSLMGPNGTTLETDDDNGGDLNSLIRNFVLREPGSYTILPEGLGSSYGAYTLSLTKAISATITFGKPVSGNIENGVFWVIEGQAGQVANIAMDEADSGLDTRLTLLGSDGIPLRTDDNSGEDYNSLIRNVVLPEHGSYTILPDGYGSSGAYTLTLSKAPTKTIDPGNPVEGDIKDGVIWTFDGRAAQIISIAMDDDNGGLDTRLTLLGPDGAILDGGVGRSKISDLFLAESGRYTILPDGYGSSGAYTLLLTEATVKSILPNEQVSGDIEDDTRWDFEGQAGQIVSIAMNEDDGTLDTRLTLLGPDGTILCTDDDSGDDANSLIRNSILPQDGSYTILPSAYSPSGTYTLLRTEVTRQPITFTELIKGNVEDGVVWTFEGSVGQIISIAMDEDDGTLDTWLTLLGPDGTILSTDDDSGDNTNSLIHNFALSENGSYTILPVGYSPTGAYTLLLTEVTHQPIAFDELIQGDIEDHVAWDFAGQAGQIVRVAMSKAGSGLDTRLTLLGPDGTIQSADNDSGYDTNSLIRGVYLPQDGVYTVLPDGYGSSGEYILILTEATVRPMNFGEMVEGDFEDDAVWAFEAQDEKIVRIEVNPDDSDVYTRLKWGKSDGTTLFTNSARGSLAVTLSLPLSGTYTLEPRGIEEGAGSYSLVLDEITTEGLLSYGDVISDEVTAASGDYWTFSGDSGDVVTIGMSSDSIHPYLQVHSPNGILLPQDASSGPNDDAEITFTLGSGTYIIVARGVDDSETGPYTLSLTQTETPPQSCSPYDPVGKEKR